MPERAFLGVTRKSGRVALELHPVRSTLTYANLLQSLVFREPMRGSAGLVSHTMQREAVAESSHALNPLSAGHRRTGLGRHAAEEAGLDRRRCA
jgi:hypothetical protein